MKTVFFIATILAIVAAACDEYEVTASVLNVRSGAGTNYRVVGSKKKGTKVCVISSSNGWKKISGGWVSGTYLKKTSSNSSNTGSSGTTKYVTASTLNIRNGPGTGYSTAGSYSKCTKVTVVSTSNGWSKLSTGKYVSSQYLSSSNPCSGSTPGGNTSSGSCSLSSNRKDSSRPAKVTSKSCNVVYYAQFDSRWGYKMYSSRNDSSQTYKSSACGPTSMAMVVATLKDKNVLPTTLGSWAVANGHRTANDGTAWSFFPAVAKKYGLSCTQTSTTDTVVSALKAGKLAVASMGKGYWTSGGHYICLYDVSGDYIVAHDPASTYRVKNTISSFKRESKSYWIFSK